MLTFFLATLFLLGLTLCWLLTVAGLPGNWLMVGAVAIYAAVMPQQSHAALGWKTVVAVLLLAALGEIVEFAASSLGVAKAGGTRRSALLALLGSMTGGIFGTILGAPIPILGSLVAAIVLAAVGAMVGAMVGEIWSGSRLNQSWQVARLALLGRLAGTLAKTLVGAVMLTLVALSMLFG